VPTELMSATEMAREYLAKSGYPFAQLHKADLDTQKRQWILVFDVSLAGTKLKRVVIDDTTGKVVAFE
jgi:hypothetical protein